MVKFKVTGDWNKTKLFLERAKEVTNLGDFNEFGRMGVEALAASTPTDTGKTAASWGYEIVHEKGRSTIYWTNDNVNDNVMIAIILQYGHATENGYYIQGIDYINPAMKPVFEHIAEKAWGEVTRI